jgi:heme/copper-type cytochrome/quinol oxidase subunit 2
MSPGLKNALVILFALASLALPIWWAVYAWGEMEGVEMSGHGWIALVLGIVVTLVVGVVLMGLVFYSSRRGYDDRVDNKDPHHFE